MRVIVTTGRTEERLTTDGVAITNGFTGRQGYEIARVFAGMGADVVLVSGPTDLPETAGVRQVDVVTMREMLEAVMAEIAAPADIFISVAAIADFSMAAPLAMRLKPGEAHSLAMVENPSIVSAVARHPSLRPKTVVSFAAQSPEDILDYATKKFERAGVDLTVANPIGGGAATTRDSSRNQVYFIYRQGNDIVTEPCAEMPKAEIAQVIVRKIMELREAL